MAERILKNYMEYLVWDQMETLLQQYPDVCDCEQCRYDIAALTLNRLTPRYVVSDKGELMMKVQSTLAQNRSDILSALVQAVQKVGAHPNH